MNNNFVSVCIPVFNSVNYIEKTIDSVLLQKHSNIEILIQDNASVDGTWDLLESIARNQPKIKIERNEKNIGMSGNWNAVIKRAKGNYVMLLSADDLLKPEFLSSCIDELEKEEVDFVSTHFFYVDKDGVIKQKLDGISNTDKIYKNFACDILRLNPFQINFTLFKKSVVEKMQKNGNFFSSRITCDYDLFLRAGIYGLKVKYIAKPLGYYRNHESNTSNNQKKLQFDGFVTLIKLFPSLFLICPKLYFLTILNIFKRLFIELIKFLIIRKNTI